MRSDIAGQIPERLVFHVDMDAFYASVEQLEEPSLRGKPVIVGGAESARGVVSSASYEARAFGVHSAMPIAQARKRCPHGVYLPGRHALYGEYSRRVMDVMADFSPIVEQVSVDEAFLDMTGTERLFGPAEASGRAIKDAIRARTGLSASVGAAGNKFLAKLASDIRKPDGLVVVPPDGVRAFLDPLPVDRLWGAGKKTVQELHRAGFYTIAQLRTGPAEALAALFGERFAIHLRALAEGRDDRELVVDWEEKSISHECTFERDSGDPDFLSTTLLELSERVARRARKDGRAGRTVTFVWRNPDFSRQSHARTLADPTDASQVIYSAALELFRETAGIGPEGTRPHRRGPRRFRLVGVRLSNFAREAHQQSLFQAPTASSGLDRAMDAVRNRFGEGAIKRARLTDRDGEL